MIDDKIALLVSIIIPVYNVESYVGRCLDSIVKQTYAPIEVIIIDDGSDDGSSRICKEYANNYYYIKLIRQTNQGQSAARNHGIQVATGDYISFVDSDDYIENDYIEYLMNLQKKYQADIAIGGFQYQFENTRVRRSRHDNYKELLLERKEAIIRLNYTAGYGAMCWAKLYKKELLMKNPFPEGQIYEDLAIMYKVFYDSEKIIYGNKPIYHWIQRNGSTMRSPFAEKHMVALTETRRQIEFFGNVFPCVLQSAKARHVAKIIELMDIALKSKDSYVAYKRLRNEMDFCSELLRDNRFKLSLKIRMLSILGGYIPTKCVFNLHGALKKVMY